MRILGQSLVAAGLIAVGYVAGVSGAFWPAMLGAQEAATDLPEESADKVKAATAAVNAAMVQLQNDKRYTPAIKGVNTFAVTVGGLNALADLKDGRGVDPETFAGLYAGLAIDEVAEKISRDDQGRLTYNNKVIRIYPISRLKMLFALRDTLAGVKKEDK